MRTAAFTGNVPERAEFMGNLRARGEMCAREPVSRAHLAHMSGTRRVDVMVCACDPAATMHNAT